MAEDKKETTATIHQVPKQQDNTLVLRVPKPNMQVAVLGIVAFITLFQTFQLVRISGSASSTTVKTAPAAATQPATGGAGSDASAPQSMVGGC